MYKRQPSLQKRLQALKKLQQAGWSIGLRFDPLLYADNFETLYGTFFDEVFNTLDMKAVHSISLGVFRLPKGFHKKLVRLYPEARLLTAPISENDGMISYPSDTENAMQDFCMKTLAQVTLPEQIFPCS